MLKLQYLQQMLISSIALSPITCAFIQKTKCCFKSSNYICLYSFVVNIIIGIIFCMTFTDVGFPRSIWVGLFSFLGADTIYKSLEGKLPSHSDLMNKRSISISRKKLINKGDNQ